MPFEYLEPSSTANRLVDLVLTTPQQALARDSEGLELEVEYLAGGGWCLELRYDRRDQGWRQPFTGDQERLDRCELILEILEDGWRLASGSESLVISRSGALAFSHNGEEYFATPGSPFARHPVPIEIYDYLVSRKVTDFSLRSSLHTSTPTVSTQMVRFSYPLPPGLVLGLPGQTGELNRSGYRFDLYNTDTFTHTPARPAMYQSWPILLHQGIERRGWVALFHDNPSRTQVDLGDFYPQNITFDSQANNTRIYIAWGATLADASNAMTTLLGPTPLPPLWAFGYQQCRWSYMSSEEIREVAHRLHNDDFPCDAIYFDIDYMDGFRVFTYDRERFGDLAECISELRSREVQSVCIIDPGVKIDPAYAAYGALKSSGAYLKDESGEPFVMRCWAGDSLLPDFGSSAGQEMWCALQRSWLNEFHFAGIWNDMNEPANFDGQNATTSRSYTARGPIAREYNLYGYHMAETSARGWLETHPSTRGLTITRSGYPGVQRHAVIWHGDNCAWWEHLRLALETSLQYALCGAFYTGADVPGFTGNPPDDLAVRFYQLGAFLPFFRGHSRYFERDKEPYAFGAEAQKHIREAIKLRYSLLREWYSGFERAIAEGRPPLMPVFDTSGALIRDQFLLFGKFLVVPVIERDQKRRTFYLPPGIWYPLGEPERAMRGDSWEILPVALSSVPIFVRGGSIIIRNTPQLTTNATLKARERYEVYADEQGGANGYRFEDDGISRSSPAPLRQRLTLEGREVTTSPW